MPVPGRLQPSGMECSGAIAPTTDDDRLDPDVPAGRVHIAPALPEGIELHITGISLGSAGHLDLRVCGTEVEVLGKPAGIDMITAPRQ